jgi:fucose 4-O-acetylase-like acetyltransferase
MTRSLSQKFRFFTFVCIALLAYVHGYNLRDNFLTPYSTVNESLTLTSFFEYLFSNGLLRFRIPLLFMISGYLYAMYDHRTYFQQIKSRFRTLIVPLLMWSAFGLLLTFLLQQIPYTADVVQKTHIDQLGDNRSYNEIGWFGVIERWLLAPISYQLWFLLTLFIFNVIYPVIKWLVIKYPYIWLPLTFLYFFLLLQLPFLDSRGLFFFSLGVWIQKKNFDIENEPSWFSLGLTLILFIGLSVIKTFMAFELEPFEFRTAIVYSPTAIVLILLHQLTILTGILAMWFGVDRVMYWFIKQKWFQYASGFSFFIFGLHVPLLPYLMTWSLMTLSFVPNYRLLCYLLVPMVVLLFSVWMGSLFRRFVPVFYKLLTGGRGF